MRILDRYIFREITLFFLISLSIFTGILVIARMLKLTSLVINRGVGVMEVLTIFISIVPTFLEVALPISTLLGVMLALGRLSADSEIVVIRGSGISLMALVRPVLYFAVVACAVNFLVSALFRPIGYEALDASLFKIASSRSTAGLNAGTFNDLGTLTLYAEEIDNKYGALKKVLIDDRRNPQDRQVIIAKSGTIISDPVDETIKFLLRDGSLHSKAENGGYNFTDFQHNVIVFKPMELSSEKPRHGKRPQEMQLAELRAEHEQLLPIVEAASEKDKEQIRDYYAIESEIVRKYSMPLACVVLALLALPLGIQPARSHNSLGATLSVLIGMSVVVLYYILLSLALTFAQDGTIPAAIGLWLPNIFFLVIAYLGLKRMGNERWVTIVHAIENIITNIGVRTGMIRAR